LCAQIAQIAQTVWVRSRLDRGSNARFRRIDCMQHLAYEGPWDVSETIVEKHNALRASTNYSVRVCVCA